MEQSSKFTPTVPRVFTDAITGDYILRSSAPSSSFVYFEDSRPNEASPHIAICLPGIGDTRRQFRFLGPQLHDRLKCRVLLGDLRGFGDSTDFEQDPSSPYSPYSPEGVADDVVQLMDELHAAHPDSSFLLLGNSLAASAMAIAAHKRKSLVKSLVLLGPILHDMAADRWFRPLSYVMFTALYGRALWIPYYKMLFPSKKPIDWEQEIEQLQAHLRVKKSNICNVGKFTRATKLQGAKALESLGQDTGAKLPVLAFYGRKDPDYSDFDEELRWVRATVPQIKVEIEDDGGHYPHVEVPEKIIQALEAMM